MLYQVKAGILGLDALGKEYAVLLKEHIKDLSLIGAAGKTQKELLFAKNDLSLEYVYSDERALMENHDIDALCIFGSAQQRPHLAIAALEAGKHLFIADPIALNVEDGEAVAKAAGSRPSQVVMVSSQVRFDTLLNTVKKVIDNGEIGMINHISLDTSFFNSINRKFASPSGSVFLDHAIDEIDLCHWLLEDTFAEVKVSVNNSTIVCDARTSKGISINLIAQPSVQKEQSYISVYGNKGQILISNTNHRSFKLYKDSGEKVDIYREEYHGFVFPEYLQLHHFTQAILGKQKRKLKSDHAVDNLKLAVAFEKAKVLEKPVEL